MTASSSTNDFFDQEEDIFGVFSPIPEMPAELEKFYKTFDNNSKGRVESRKLAEKIFPLLVENNFRPIKEDGIGKCMTEGTPEDWFAEFYPYDMWEKFTNENPGVEWNELNAAIESHRELLIEEAKLKISRANAMKICASCPIAASCLAASVTMRTEDRQADTFDEFGIYGGYDGDSRRRIFDHMQKMKKSYIADLKAQGIKFVDPMKNKTSEDTVIVEDDDSIFDETVADFDSLDYADA